MTKSFAVNKLTAQAGLAYLTRCSLRFYEDINTPVSLACWILLNEGEYEQLQNRSVCPMDYIDADRFHLDYQAVTFLKKVIFSPHDDKRSKAALTKFLASEQQCRDFNESYKTRLRDISGIFLRMQYIIARILGDIPDIASFDLKLGPGATSAVSGRQVTIPGKFEQGDPQCTLGAVPYAMELLRNNPALYSAKTGIYIEGPASVPAPRFKSVQYNQLTFVPKNAEIDRCICIEPEMNIALQLAVGSHIRRRLFFKAGIDLNKQQSVNAKYARLGSIDGSYATIDLSSASDTISYMLVMELLPPTWFKLLDDLRSPFTNIGSKSEPSLIVNEKFSSMGNGYTFELETLIFYCAAKAVQFEAGEGGHVMAYGDDIIVPTQIADRVIEVLKCLGFSINMEKTYTTGPFRESCGEDYFLGKNVRPTYLKEIPSYETDKFKMANRIRIAAKRYHNYDNACSARFRYSWTLSVRATNRKYRLYGPEDFGDAVIYTPFGERSPVPTMFGVCKIRTVLLRPQRGTLSGFRPGVQRAAGLFGCSWRFPYRGTAVPIVSRPQSVAMWDRYTGYWN